LRTGPQRARSRRAVTPFSVRSFVRWYLRSCIGRARLAVEISSFSPRWERCSRPFSASKPRCTASSQRRSSRRRARRRRRARHLCSGLSSDRRHRVTQCRHCPGAGDLPGIGRGHGHSRRWSCDQPRRAVPVPAGMHRVNFTYEPVTFTIGARLSLGALALWGALLLLAMGRSMMALASSRSSRG